MEVRGSGESSPSPLRRRSSVVGQRALQELELAQRLGKLVLVELGQRSTWHADGQGGVGTVAEWALGLATVAGWLVSTVFVVSFARFSRSE